MKKPKTYNLKRSIYESINNTKLIDTLKGTPDGIFRYEIPICIYQAYKILILTGAAKWEMEDSRISDGPAWVACDGLVFAVSEIVRIMSLSRLPYYTGKSRKSLGNKGKQWPRSILIAKAIEKTANNNKYWSNKGLFNADDVINTIRDYREDEFEVLNLGEFINIKGNPAVKIEYHDINAAKVVTFEIAKKTIENKISSFRN